MILLFELSFSYFMVGKSDRYKLGMVIFFFFLQSSWTSFVASTLKFLCQVMKYISYQRKMQNEGKILWGCIVYRGAIIHRSPWPRPVYFSNVPAEGGVVLLDIAVSWVHRVVVDDEAVVSPEARDPVAELLPLLILSGVGAVLLFCFDGVSAVPLRWFVLMTSCRCCV